MAEFNFDDSVDDLLSDDSDDSFFDDPKLPPKKTAFKQKTPEKKSVADVFGLSENKGSNELVKNVAESTPINENQKSESDWLGLTDTTKPPAIQAARDFKKTKNVSFEDDDDILGTLGLNIKSEPKGNTEVAADRKSNTGIKINKNDLFNDILGTSATVIIESRKPELSKSVSQLPKTATSELQSSILSDPVLSMPSETRRPRLPRSNLVDPLGLFSKETKPAEEVTSTPKAMKIQDVDQMTESSRITERRTIAPGDTPLMETKVVFPPVGKDLHTNSAPSIPDLPDWLGGASVKQHKSEPDIHTISKTTSIRRSSLQQEENESNEPLANNVNNFSPQVAVPSNPNFDPLMTQQRISAAHLEYQNTSLAMQQQESQLLMSLQLKKYDDKLMDMQKQQQDILTKQEHQFNSLLERQFAKQQIMENNLRMQQERINNHIQLLISQPSVASYVKETEREQETERTSHSKYEDVLDGFKQRQREETFLLEESYKKQIGILEQSMESMEKYLKMELNNLVEGHKMKLKQIEAAHEEEIAMYKQKIHEMAENQKAELHLLRDNHMRVVEEIKDEYSLMVNNLKQRKQMEESLVGNSSEYIQKLDNSLQLLDSAGKTLIQVQTKVAEQENSLSLSRQETLRAKENEIELMRAALEKARETTETERAQLMGLVRTLETKLAEQNQNSREERWALQQATATLTARTAALDREAEFNRQLLEREQEQIKTLKESILAEQERSMLQITEEKLALQAEKLRLETAAKLSQSYDPQKCRAEIDVAVRVAKEAAERTDRERENLLQQQYEMEMLKRNLADQEKKLLLKEKDLQTVTRSAEYKIKESEKALDEAKTLEIKYNERLRDIQHQLVSLTNRERKLAEEKIVLSKERLALHTLTQQTRKCGLCAVDVSAIDEKMFRSGAGEKDLERYVVTVNDPDILHLRLAMEDEHIIFQNNVD